VLKTLQSFSSQFSSDGITEVYSFDLSLAPFNVDFRGNLPVGLANVIVQSSQINPSTNLPIGILSGVTATLAGTTVTLTFPTAPIEFDATANLVLYNLTFILQYPD
jgi:hypothetical protein